MRQQVLCATLLLVSTLAFVPLDADSNTAVIAVSATVRKNCLISTTPVAYGSYDPIGANATTPLDASGTVVLTCTKGTAASIGLDSGANAQGPTRRMRNGATAYLTYELYQDNAHTIVWTNNGRGMMSIPAAPSKNPRSFTVHGRVAGAQDVPIGSFNDSVVATVNF